MKQILTDEEIDSCYKVAISTNEHARAIEQRILEKIGEVQAWQYPDMRTYSSEEIASLKFNTQFALQLYVIPFLEGE